MTEVSGAVCDFCGIARNEERAVRVLGTDTAVGFFPTNPATLGHTLLIPRQHVPNIWHLDDATARDLTIATLRVATAIREALRPEGMNIIQSNGEVATQTVSHLHVHVVPRWSGDAMGRIWPERTDFPDHALGGAQKRIRAALATGRAQ